MDRKAEDQPVDHPKPEHHKNVIERVAEDLESRFLAAAEVATETTSAETNLAMAALTAIEGPPKAAPAGGEPEDDDANEKPAPA